MLFQESLVATSYVARLPTIRAELLLIFLLSIRVRPFTHKSAGRGMLN
jgi:hypothetical protein